MRVRSWFTKVDRDSNSIDQEGPPWIELVPGDPIAEDRVKLSITGPAPNSQQVRVLFTKSEWPVIKARVDAAFAGTDPNLSEFYGVDQ